MKVLVSVIGQPLLGGRHFVKYLIIRNVEVCSVSPLIPSLLRMTSEGSTGESRESIGLVLLYPHSLTVVGWDRDDIRYDELLLDDLIDDGSGGPDCSRLKSKLEEAIEKVRNMLDPNRICLLAYLEGGGSSHDLSSIMSELRVLVLPVQVRGTFPLRSVARGYIRAPITFKGHPIDAFGKTYIGLRALFHEARNAREDGGQGFEVYVDTTSGMNELAIMSLLGAMTFSEIYGCRLRSYRTDPYISELAEHCSPLPTHQQDRGGEGRVEITARLPLTLAEVERVWDIFTLVRSMISILGASYRSLTREIIESGLEAVAREIEALRRITEGDWGVWTSDLRHLINSFRRLLCGLEGTVVPYIHMCLLDLAGKIRAPYEKEGSLYRELEGVISSYLDGSSGGIRSECSRLSVEARRDGGPALKVEYGWFAGGLLPLLDALAKSIRSVVDWRFGPEVSSNGRRLSLRVGPFITPELIADLVFYYLSREASTNLSLLVQELGIDVDVLEKGEEEIKEAVRRALSTRVDRTDKRGDVGSFYGRRARAHLQDYVKAIESLRVTDKDLYDALVGFITDPPRAGVLGVYLGTYELYYLWRSRENLEAALEALKQHGASLSGDDDTILLELTYYDDFGDLLSKWSREDSSREVKLGRLRDRVRELVGAASNLMSTAIDLERRKVASKESMVRNPYLRNFLLAKLLERGVGIGKGDLEMLRRHVLAHAGLTHFTIKDAIAGRIAYSSAFFKALEGYDRGASICDSGV